MKTRILTLLTLLLTSPLAGQELTPTQFADSVEAGAMEAIELFDIGCPSDTAWTDSALAALEDRAETDVEVRTSLANAITARIADCPGR